MVLIQRAKLVVIHAGLIGLLGQFVRNHVLVDNKDDRENVFTSRKRAINAMDHVMKFRIVILIFVKFGCPGLHGLSVLAVKDNSVAWGNSHVHDNVLD